MWLVYVQLEKGVFWQRARDRELRELRSLEKSQPGNQTVLKKNGSGLGKVLFSPFQDMAGSRRPERLLRKGVNATR